MNQSVPKDRLNMINSLLDQELDFLTSSSKGYTDKENFDSQKPPRSSKKLTQSVGSNASDKSSELTNSKGPRDVTNQESYNLPRPVFRNDLLDLQTKISCLEKKLEVINRQPSPRSHEDFDLGESMNSFAKFESNKFHKDDTIESPEFSPLRKKYGDHSMIKNTAEKMGHSITDSSPFREGSTHRSSKSSPETKRTGSAKRAGRKSHRKVDSKVLELSIKEAQGQLDQTKYQVRQRSSSKGRLNTMPGSAKKKKNSDVEGDPAKYHDVVVMNKKLMELKKEEDEYRSALLTQRTSNQELAFQLDKLNMKERKMKGDLDKLSKVEKDFNKLMESFEKSEFIRNKQKEVIEILQQELKGLRKQNEESLAESSRSKVKKTTISKTKKL